MPFWKKMFNKQQGVYYPCTSNGTYTRALVDSDQLEWIELSADTKDQDPTEGDGGSGDIDDPTA